MTLWLSNVAAYSIQFGVLVATAAAVTSALRLQQPRTALAFWQVLLGVGVLLPLMQSWSGTSPDFVTSSLSLTAAATGAVPGVTRELSVATLLAIAMAAGVLIRLAWLGLGLLKLRQLTGDADRSAGDLSLFAELADRLGARAQLRLTDQIDGPVTVGVRPAMVLLPRRVLDLPVAVQRAILCHELIHVRRRDWLNTMAEEILCAVLWFHPAARMLASRLGLARETLVDQETIALTNDRRSYAEALLAFSNPQPRLVAATPFIRRRHQAQRVALITQEVAMSHRRAVALAAVAAIAVLIATATAVARFPIVTTLAAQEIVQPGKDVTMPRVIKEVRPSYTKAAMDAKIQGSVFLKIVVSETGNVGDVEVSRSLDTVYGLDEEAIKAARDWKFEPGRKAGKAVPVQVTLELTFTLR